MYEGNLSDSVIPPYAWDNPFGMKPSVIPEYILKAEPDESINIEGLKMSPGIFAAGALGLVAIYGISLAGLTAIHRKRGASWYCSLVPSSFWSGLITAAVGGFAAGAMIASGAASLEQD